MDYTLLWGQPEFYSHIRMLNKLRYTSYIYIALIKVQNNINKLYRNRLAILKKYCLKIVFLYLLLLKKS